ncbi:MAG: GspH/FimT family pseudopilin [Betaproteobacteria bacterium]|nr:GspH/FimT family pseudopilin [Betaproteobacteria bacterium]MCL4697713.1 GspH/FimT family pseudopilin [Burkholderiaceae bacterium]
MNTSPASRPVTARRTGAARLQRGFTVVEGLICVSVLLVAVSAALPSFGTAREQKRVEGAAAQLETDLQLTRSLAVAQNRTMRFEFGRDEHGTCYVVHSGAAGDCTCAPQGAVCRAGVVAHRVQHLAADTAVAVQANVGSMVFDPLKGTVTPTATIRVEGPRTSIRQIVNIMGRIRSCSPDGALPGYKAC